MHLESYELLHLHPHARVVEQSNAGIQVKQYARQFGFQEEQKAALGSRLRALDILLKQHAVRTSEDLLEAAAQAQDALQRWDILEGENDIVSLQSCKSLAGGILESKNGWMRVSSNMSLVKLRGFALEGAPI